MPIDTLLLDLDDTLVIEYASVDAAFALVSAMLQERHGVDPAAFTEIIRQRARVHWHASPYRAWCVAIGVSSWEGFCSDFPGEQPPLPGLRAWAPGYRQAAWNEALQAFGIHDPALAEELCAAFRRDRRTRHVPFADALPALQDLQHDYRLALMTNGASDLQRNKLEGSGLAGFFPHVFVSGEIAVGDPLPMGGKPDPRIFRFALDTLGVPAERAVMVGNNLSADIAGAHAAGLRGVWVNRVPGIEASGVTPDAEIADMRQLREVLEGALGRQG
ncbi:MAG: HAD family hydrolase [Anaerolineae bacterium]